MGKRALAAVALGLLAGAWSGGREAQREEAPATVQKEQTVPKTGILTSVNNQRLMIDPIDDPGTDTELFERTTRSIAIRQGQEIRWDQLKEGDVVRVTWDRGLFGPDRVARVEVLPPHEAEEIRQQMLDQSERDTGIGSPLEPREIPSPSGWPADGDDGGSGY